MNRYIWGYRYISKYANQDNLNQKVSNSNLSLLLRHLCNQLSLFNSQLQVIQHQNLHLLLCLIGIRTNVRQQHNPWVTQQTGVNLGLFLVHVQTSRADL